jgi:hypothetical protein
MGAVGFSETSWCHILDGSTSIVTTERTSNLNCVSADLVPVVPVTSPQPSNGYRTLISAVHSLDYDVDIHLNERARRYRVLISVVQLSLKQRAFVSHGLTSFVNNTYFMSVPCLHGMARPQVVNTGDGIQISEAAINIM